MIIITSEAAFNFIEFFRNSECNSNFLSMSKSGLNPRAFLRFLDERCASLLFSSAVISISLLQILNVFYLVFSAVRKKLSFDGKLKWGIYLYSSSTLVGTFLFNPSFMFKAVGEAFLPFIYFIRPRYDSFLFFIIPVSGLICFVVWAVRFTVYGEHKIFWGGIFRPAEFFSVFSLTTFIISLKFRNERKKFLLLFSLGLLFLVAVFVIKRRSFLIGYPIVGILSLVFLSRNGFLDTRKVLAFVSLSFFFMLSSMIYVVLKDERFEPLRKYLRGEKVEVNTALNTVTSARYMLLSAAVRTLKEDIEEGNIINILFGHGIRAGNYILGGNASAPLQRLESVIFVSELVERGIIGLVGEIIIWFYVTMFFVRGRANDPLVLVFAVPLALHLFGSVFRPFWNVTLPLYLLLFRIAESQLKKQKI